MTLTSVDALENFAFFIYSSSMTLISVEILESLAFFIYSSSMSFPNVEMLKTAAKLYFTYLQRNAQMGFYG
jgi:hypothetical protein